MTDRGTAAVLAALVAAQGAACLSVSPEDEARRGIRCSDDRRGGEDEDEGGPEHCAGEPCLVCHGEDYHPGEKIFVVAGTVYLRPTDTVGLRGAEVIMRDAAGRELTALTNDAGNFMVEVRGDVQSPVQRDNGKLRVPSAPVFPLWIKVRYGALEAEMVSRAWREGSCAGCHTRAPGADSVGQIYLVDQP